MWRRVEKMIGRAQLVAILLAVAGVLAIGIAASKVGKQPKGSKPAATLTTSAFSG